MVAKKLWGLPTIDLFNWMLMTEEESIIDKSPGEKLRQVVDRRGAPKTQDFITGTSRQLQFLIY